MKKLSKLRASNKEIVIPHNAKAAATLLLRCVISVVLTLALTIGTGLYFYNNGIIVPNNANGYKVRGIDVSFTQGKIQWDVLAKELDFAYIKATEGSDITDPQFERNRVFSSAEDIRTGFYMYFDYDCTGEKQADFFFENVGEPEDMLPPAIYLELYKGYNDRPLPKNIVDQQLSDSISRLRAYYGIFPVIFCTQRTYDLYVKNEYPDCDIWIKDVFCEPSLSDGRDWTFWQYSEKGQLPGYDGPDKYIEMDVFAGTKEEFLNYGIVNNFSDLFL